MPGRFTLATSIQCLSRGPHLGHSGAVPAIYVDPTAV